jgi:nicotinate-nucleotide adenylyltransferase
MVTRSDAQTIGLFGGTFDPVHLGHLNAVQTVHQLCQFNQVRWILSARPPHKNQTSCPIHQRYEMLELALADYSCFQADDTEIKRSDLSYTYSTLKDFRVRYPDASLNLIIGGDSIEKIHTWYRYIDLLSLANIVVMNRPGYEAKIPTELRPNQLAEAADIGQQKYGRIASVSTTDYPISSTQIRALLADPNARFHTDVQALIDPSVYHYIIENQLYLPSSSH